MIDIKELRYGNWIYEICDRSENPASKEPFQVGGVNGIYNTIADTEDRITQTSYCEPIPLTPEILGKCGFEQSNEFDDTFRLKQFDLFYRKSYCEWTIDDRGDNEGSKLRVIKYLHQLQNLFYMVESNELKIDL